MSGDKLLYAKSIINGLLSKQKDVSARDTAGVRGQALLCIFIHDLNDGIERIIRLADDTTLGLAAHWRIS